MNVLEIGEIIGNVGCQCRVSLVKITMSIGDELVFEVRTQTVKSNLSLWGIRWPGGHLDETIAKTTACESISNRGSKAAKSSRIIISTTEQGMKNKPASAET